MVETIKQAMVEELQAAFPHLRVDIYVYKNGESGPIVIELKGVVGSRELVVGFYPKAAMVCDAPYEYADPAFLDKVMNAVANYRL